MWPGPSWGPAASLLGGGTATTRGWPGGASGPLSGPQGHILEFLEAQKFKQGRPRGLPATYHVHHHLDGNLRVLTDVVLALQEERPSAP